MKTNLATNNTSCHVWKAASTSGTLLRGRGPASLHALRKSMEGQVFGARAKPPTTSRLDPRQSDSGLFPLHMEFFFKFQECWLRPYTKGRCIWGETFKQIWEEMRSQDMTPALGRADPGPLPGVPKIRGDHPLCICVFLCSWAEFFLGLVYWLR